MNNFFLKFEKILINIIVIILILLISAQFIMKNEYTYERLHRLKLSIKNIFNDKNKTINVSKIDKLNSQGKIIINLLNNVSLPQVWVLINGEKIANFDNGIVQLFVRDGDLISIDSRAYNKTIWFEITYIQSFIKNLSIGEQFRLNSEKKVISLIKFNDKL
jgi:hypothetical protein